MSAPLRLSRPLVAGALGCLAVACGRTDAGSADSALARDLTLATSDAARAPRTEPIGFADTAVTAPPPAAPTTARRPAETRPRASTSPTPATPAAVTRAPAPAVPTTPAVAAAPTPAPDSAPTATPTAAPAAAPARTAHVFGAGTGLVLATTQPICTTTSQRGDRFVATLSEPVTAPDGGTLPAGTNVVLELVSVPARSGDKAHVELVARGIALDGDIHPITAEVASVEGTADKAAVANPSAGGDRGKVGRGAVTGAILGRIFGGGMKGTVIGAAAGAAAGAISARGAYKFEGCLPQGATVRVKLTADLAVRTA